jgi:hypothetical protein
MNGISIFLGLTGGALAAALFSAHKGSPYGGGCDLDFSWVIGTLVGLYIWFPFHYWWQEDRATMLHSDLRVYPVPLKTAFDTVHKMLAEANYNLCDKWRIASDPHAREIRAQLLFSDMDEQYVMGSLMNVGSKITPMRRSLELTVHFEEYGNDTEIHADFTPHVEGPQWQACDRIVNDFYNQMQAKFGMGMFIGKRDRAVMLAAPPEWLLALTGIVTVVYFFRVLTGFMGAH